MLRMPRMRLTLSLLGAALLAGQSAPWSPGLAQAATSSASSTGHTPLTDMGAQTYYGFGGGLYTGGSNTVPADHDSAGRARAAAVTPLDPHGRPSAQGKIVLLSIGMSNTSDE